MVIMTKKKIERLRTFWLRIAFALALLFLVSFIIWVIVFSTFQATHVSTYAANGTFQLYNPLRRIADGQIIGYDFPFFHGIGVPLLHYPFFSLFGGGLFAAELAKWTVSPILFLASSFIFFYALFRDVKKATISTSLFTILAFFCIDAVWPSNSLIGLRGTFPVLVAAALLWTTSKKLKIKKFELPLNELFAIILIGISPLFGTEQGLAAILGYAIVKFFLIFKTRQSMLYKFHQSLRLALIGSIILSISFIVYTLFTAGHPFDALRYALIDIPKDQGWYFGADPIPFLEWGNLLPALFRFEMRYLLGTLALGTVATFFIVKYAKRRQLNQTIGFMLAYGIVGLLTTVIGYYQPDTQLIPLERMMGLVIIAAITIPLFSDRLWYWKPNSTRTKTAKTLIIIFGLILFVALPLVSTHSRIFQSKEYDVKANLKLALQAKYEDDYFVASTGWKASVDAFRPYIDPSKKIWSTYTGIYDSYFGKQLNTSRGGEDYIIHALGDERRDEYATSFKNQKPTYVITLRPSYFVFEEWLWNRDWEFYEELTTHYKIIAKNDSHFLWLLDDHPIKTADSIAIPISDNSFTMPENTTDQPVVYTVNLTYAPKSSLPGTTKASRYLLKVKDSEAQMYRISLPSHKNNFSFPIIVPPHTKSLNVTASAEGIIPLKSLTLLKVNYRKIDVNQKALQLFTENICITKNVNGGMPEGQAFSSCAL